MVKQKLKHVAVIYRAIACSDMGYDKLHKVSTAAWKNEDFKFLFTDRYK